QIIKRELSKREKGISSSYEVELIGKRGTKRNVIISGAPLFLSENKIHSTIGTITDITDQKKAEKALMKTHDELEHRVTERTRELEIKTQNLEETNIAMKVLLKKREEDRKDIEYNILTNVKKLIDPYFDKIRKTKLDSRQKAFLNIMESNLQEITSQFARKISLRELNLTPTEIQIANMIRQGNSSKEIAEIMNVSIRTVDAHRRNIRKKIGLNQKRANLRSYLLSLH
ncbi:MAG: LuxR C-terminal-related transcriptional regulator, partial [Desulfobacterales bacterium]